MREETKCKIVIGVGTAVFVMVLYQLATGQVFGKYESHPVGEDWPWLLIEFSGGAWAVVQGIRGLGAGSWPP